MPRLTRRFRKTKKNKTFKRGGSIEPEINDEREGIIDILKNKVSDIASSAITTAEDAGLKIAGLERIDKTPEEEQQASSMISSIENTANEASNAVINNVNKVSTEVIDNVNEVLDSNTVKETISQAGKDTVDIIGDLAQTFNQSMNDPIVKQEVEKAIENAGEIGSVMVEAAKEPFNKAVDVAAETIPKATGAAISGAVKIGTDALGAIPGVGGVIEIDKIINDGSKAASAIVEAGSEAPETASDLFIETKSNMEKGMKALEEKKKMAEQISNRTTKSINQFQNPIQQMKNVSQMGGNRKTKRRLFKRNYKSKRVRFAI
jgi:hypothetical protein